MSGRENPTVISAVAALIAYSLIVLIIITVIRVPRAGGHEASIYDVYPTYFWLSIIGSTVLGEAIMIKHRNSNWSKSVPFCAGFTAVICTLAVLLLMPLIRGYAAYGNGDTLTYVGYAKEIIRSGEIGSNPYPALHILAAAISMLTSIDVMTVSLFIPPLFTLFYILTFYVMAKKLLSSRGELAFALILAMIPIFGLYNLMFAPYPESFFLVPLFLFVYLKAARSKSRATFVLLMTVMGVLLVIFHPLTVILIILLLFVSSIAKTMQEEGYRKVVRNPVTRFKIQKPYGIISILFTLVLAWANWLYVMIGNITLILDPIIGKGIPSELQQHSNAIQAASPSIAETAVVAFETYGVQIILGIFSIYAFSRILADRRLKGERTPLNQTFICNEFMTFLFVYLAIFLLAYTFGSLRIFTYLGVFGCLLISVTLGATFNQRKDRPSNRLLVRKALAVVALFSLLITSVFGLFWAPANRNETPQVTKGEFVGMTFFFETRDKSVKTLEVDVSQRRFFEAIYGPDSPKVNVGYGPFFAAPDHLGYDSHSSFADSFDGSRYLLISEGGRVYWPSTWPEFESRWRFSLQDFEHLELDSRVCHVFSNGELDVYLTNP
jgi:hypothetical protein